MEEVWGVLGITGCTTCLAHPKRLGDTTGPPAAKRSLPDTLKAIREARAMTKVAGKSKELRTLLARHRLTTVHLEALNPFLLLPHFDWECFPMDWLHGVCVLLWRIYLSCSMTVWCVTLAPPQPTPTHRLLMLRQGSWGGEALH